MREMTELVAEVKLLIEELSKHDKVYAVEKLRTATSLLKNTVVLMTSVGAFEHVETVKELVVLLNAKTLEVLTTATDPTVLPQWRALNVACDKFAAAAGGQ